jgi:hypothetical protein
MFPPVEVTPVWCGGFDLQLPEGLTPEGGDSPF